MSQGPPATPPAGGGEQRYQPFVPESVSMAEFTLRAVLIGLPLTLILGAANAYLGLKAGITIAATYPAAVLSMAILRLFKKGTILEENIARTAGSIGESVAAGAIFTLPAFVIAGVWPSFSTEDAYWKSTALMLVGSVLGVLFVSLVRRVMVEDRTLVFPESVAASEIHKAGRRGSEAAKYLFYNMGLGGLIYVLGEIKLFAVKFEPFVELGKLGLSKLKLGAAADAPALPTGGVTQFSAPSVSPAYIGVGYIIGPELAALNFSGGVLAWGLMVPLLIFFLGPQLQEFLPPGAEEGHPAVVAGGLGDDVDEVERAAARGEVGDDRARDPTRGTGHQEHGVAVQRRRRLPVPGRALGLLEGDRPAQAVPAAHLDHSWIAHGFGHENAGDLCRGRRGAPPRPR